MNLLPPSQMGEYLSRQALIDALQAHAMSQGYAVTIRRSCNRDGIVTLGCDRSGQYDGRGLNETNRVRDTGSRLINCPFSVRGKLKNGIWAIEVRNPDHNHDASLTPMAHPIQRRIPDEVKQRVQQLSASGVPARQIITTIRQSGNHHTVIVDDIYNIRKQLRRENLAGKTPMEALLIMLKDSDWTFNYQTDSADRVTHLFFSHPRSVELLNRYPDVLLLDCTYKTNRFKMPLLSIVGCTCLESTFYAAFCFLPHEEEDYSWAMIQFKGLLLGNKSPQVMITDRELALINAIQAVFPITFNIICMWHVEKNVLVHVSKTFVQTADSNGINSAKKKRDGFMGDWTAIIRCTNKIEYETLLKDFRYKYRLTAAPLVHYVESTWLVPWKRNLVRAWVDDHLHLGHRVTSRVESSHCTLKKYLQTSTGDLKTVFDRIKLLLVNEHAKYDSLLDRDRTRIPHTAMNPFYGQLVGHISGRALGYLWNQRRRLTVPEPLVACTGTFAKSMGMPCAHQMQLRLQEGGVLYLNEIHSHWHFQPKLATVMELLVLEPLVASTRGRPTDAEPPSHRRPNRATILRQTASSTRREPSAFERIPTSNNSTQQTRKPSGRIGAARRQTKRQEKTKRDWRYESPTAEDEIAEKELQNLIATDGRASPLWTKEPDLVGFNAASRSYARRNRTGVTGT